MKEARNTHDLAHGRPVVLVSHGFQTNYERGFTNGLADAGVAVTLVSSDRTDYAGLRPGIHTVNLRGSQEEDRPGWAKALNMLRYHLGLCAYVLWRRQAIRGVRPLAQQYLGIEMAIERVSELPVFYSIQFVTGLDDCIVDYGVLALRDESGWILGNQPVGP